MVVALLKKPYPNNPINWTIKTGIPNDKPKCQFKSRKLHSDDTSGYSIYLFGIRKKIFTIKCICLFGYLT